MCSYVSTRSQCHDQLVNVKERLCTNEFNAKIDAALNFSLRQELVSYKLIYIILPLPL